MPPVPNTKPFYASVGAGEGYLPWHSTAWYRRHLAETQPIPVRATHQNDEG